MSEAQYPSAEFPAAPAVTLTCPDDWAALLLPQALVAAGYVGNSGDQFRANVTVTRSRTSGISLQDAAEATTSALAASPEWQEISTEYLHGLGGHDCFLAEGTFRHPDAGTLHQLAEVVVVSSGPYLDLVQVVGTCAADQAAERLPEIRSILADATVSPV
jgi:hypothetical protein